MVKIFVGATRQEFNMHKALLCNISPYFSAALKGSFKEAEELKIEMSEEDPRAFEYFQLWAYTGHIITESETEKDITNTVLVQLYVFAEARDISRLQNAAIDVLIDKIATSNTIPTAQLPFVYANTTEHYLLRRLFIDEMATTCDLHNPKYFREPDRNMYPTEFLVDLIRAISEKRKEAMVPISYYQKIRSEYHI